MAPVLFDRVTTMRAIRGHVGAAAFASIAMACTHGRSGALSRPTVAQPVAAAAVVLVGADGALTLDARRVSEADLHRALQTESRGSPRRAVTVAGTAGARHGDVLRALDVVARAGAGAILLAAPDLHPLTAFPRPTGEAGARYVRLSVDGGGRVWLDHTPVGDGDLPERARDLLAAWRRLTVVVAADRSARYSRVSVVIDALRRAGVTDFLITNDAPAEPLSGNDVGAPQVATAQASVGPTAHLDIVNPMNLADRPLIACNEDVLRNFFPETAIERGVTGMRVMLRVTVDGSGAIVDARATDDPGFGLGSAAERAVMTGCRSSVPRDRAGRPAATVVMFRMNFELEDDVPAARAPVRSPAPWGRPR